LMSSNPKSAETSTSHFYTAVIRIDDPT